MKTLSLPGIDVLMPVVLKYIEVLLLFSVG
jgi:hypothetical protein